jgi:hypothetical protein
MLAPENEWVLSISRLRREGISVCTILDSSNGVLTLTAHLRLANNPRAENLERPEDDYVGYFERVDLVAFDRPGRRTRPISFVLGEEGKELVRDNLNGATSAMVVEEWGYKASWKRWEQESASAQKDRRKKGVNKEKRVCKA